MTKISALNPNLKEGDEKPKELEGITISSTTPHATFYPVTLPISSIVAKKKCGTSHIIIILLSLMTLSILFYMIPDFFYKKVHHLVSSEVTVSGSASSWAQRPSRFDVAEEDTHVLPKLDSSDVSEKMNRMDQNGDMMQDNHDSRIVGNQDGEIAGNDDGEVKQLDDAIPNRFEAMKAIATLLKIPGVQQVAVIQNNGRMPDNMMMKPEVVPNVPLVPQMEMKEWDLMNYRRAIREWLLRREMFRRRMLAEMEREREEAAERKMSQIIMGLQLQEQPERSQLESMLPLLAYARMHMISPPSMMWMNNMQSPSMEVNQRNMPMLSMISPPMVVPGIPPMHPFMISKQQTQQQQQLLQQQLQQQQLQQQQLQQQQLQQQQQQQQQPQPQPPLQPQPPPPPPPPPQQQQQPAIMPIKLMPSQMLNREEPIIQPIGSNSGKSSSTPLQIRDDTINRLDLEQKKLPVPVVDQPIPMTPDGTPDRDTIFKELRSLAQMQQQMSQTVLPAIMIPPLVPSVVPPAQINSDEIFRELQHRALRMQLEQDRLEAEQRTEKEKNMDSEVPVLMIADTFPRRPVETIAEQTSEEIAGVTTAANIETTMIDSNSGNSSSESLSTFFNFFDKHENEITNSLDKEQEITVKNDEIKAESEHSAEEDNFGDMPVVGNDGVGLIVKPDDTAPQVNFIQETVTTETPAIMDTSEEAHSELFKSATFQDETDDNTNNGSEILNTPIRLLETPQIQ